MGRPRNALTDWEEDPASYGIDAQDPRTWRLPPFVSFMEVRRRWPDEATAERYRNMRPPTQARDWPEAPWDGER